LAAWNPAHDKVTMGSSNGFAGTLQIKDGEATMTAARAGGGSGEARVKWKGVQIEFN
jgi:hypothetical protein